MESKEFAYLNLVATGNMNNTFSKSPNTFTNQIAQWIKQENNEEITYITPHDWCNAVKDIVVDDSVESLSLTTEDSYDHSIIETKVLLPTSHTKTDNKTYTYFSIFMDLKLGQFCKLKIQGDRPHIDMPSLHPPIHIYSRFLTKPIDNDTCPHLFEPQNSMEIWDELKTKENQEFQLKLKSNKNDLFEFSLSDLSFIQNYDQNYYIQYWLSRDTVSQMSHMEYMINDNIILNIDARWLEVQNSLFVKQYLILLPIPPTCIDNKKVVFRLTFTNNKQTVEESDTLMIRIYKKSNKPSFSPTPNNKIDNKKTIVIPQTLGDITFGDSYELKISNCKFLNTKRWFLLINDKNQLLTTDKPCPFKNIYWTYFSNKKAMEISYEMLSVLNPLFYPNTSPHSNHQPSTHAYQMVFHQTPNCFPYPLDYLNKTYKEAFTGLKNEDKNSPLCISAFNASRMDFECFKVDWDEEVIKTHYSNEYISVRIVAESVNLLLNSGITQYTN